MELTCAGCGRERDNMHATTANKCKACLAEQTAEWRLRTKRTKSRKRGRRRKVVRQPRKNKWEGIGIRRDYW